MSSPAASTAAISKCVAPLPPQPARFGGSRIRAGRAGVFRIAVCDHRDRNHVLRKPGAGNHHPGFRAHDPDRSGAERGLIPRRISRPMSAARSPHCSTAPRSMLTWRAIHHRFLWPDQHPDRRQRQFHQQHAVQPRGRLQHRRREAVLSMAAVRHRAWLQHLESGRQPAAAGRHGRVPQRAVQ